MRKADLQKEMGLRKQRLGCHRQTPSCWARSLTSLDFRVWQKKRSHSRYFKQMELNVGTPLHKSWKSGDVVQGMERQPGEKHQQAGTTHPSVKGQRMRRWCACASPGDPLPRAQQPVGFSPSCFSTGGLWQQLPHFAHTSVSRLQL